MLAKREKDLRDKTHTFLNIFIISLSKLNGSGH